MYKALSLTVALIAAICCFPVCLSSLGLLLLTIICFSIGVFLVIWAHIFLSSQHKTGLSDEGTIFHKELEQFHNNLMQMSTPQTSTTLMDGLPIILGRTLDGLLQQLMDYILRDFVSCYLNQYAYNSQHLITNIKEDLWGGIQVLHERLTRVDHAKLIACDLVSKITAHFEKIREAQSEGGLTTKPVLLSAHLKSKEQELDYLRNLSELLIMLLLPRSYSLSPAKYFLREILACKVLLPSINNITDPDCFNRNVIVYIEGQRAIASLQGNTFKSANSFEEYLKIIQKSDDLELLKRFRYDIVTKIMQATTLQNVKRAKGVDLDSSNKTSGSTNKAELNAAKKLKKYIEQLMQAKKECEKRLTDLGWNINYNVKNMLPLPSILDSMLGRRFLSNYLETVSSQGLVGYWTAVEELRTAPRKNWHQLGAEIFYTYIRNPSAEIKVDKNTRKRVEAFLLGDKGPEVFYEIQQQVVHTLEERYYQPFINSDFYTNLLRALEHQRNETEVDRGMEERTGHVLNELSSSLDASLHVGDHSNYAKSKLDELQEKLYNKNQALQALRSSLKPESRVLTILEREVEWLQGEQRQLEAHLTRTETWGENLGKWRAVVQSAEIPDEKEPPQFVIVVDMIEEENLNEEISSGWVVSRNLTQFHELHRKLRPLCSELRNLELPTQSFKFLFGKIDKNSLEKAKLQIQKYLEFVLEDDRLNQSEAIYSFLSPSSEHLKQSIPSPKKTKFSFSTLFKSSSSSASDQSASKDVIKDMRESEEEDISHCLDATGSSNADHSSSTDFHHQKLNGHSKLLEDKDTIAEPLYSLLSEIFDMRGLFKYLRKTLIAFVQITYGRTINRQIYDTISWYLSEQMLYYYINVFMKSWWPGGELAGPSPFRSEREKRATANKARGQFITNVPEVLVTLVGANAAKNGARKFFDVLQNKQMNKQLFYELLEVILNEVFPELEVKESY